MTRTITRLFNSQADAVRAVEALEEQGVSHDHINLIVGGGDRAPEQRSFAEGEPREHHTARDTGAGAAVGGLLGGGAGLLAGIGLLAVPGMGLVLAAGFLTTALAGAAAGAMTGGLVGALHDAGENEEDARVYAEGLRRGGALVTVRGDTDDIARAAEILTQHGGVDALARGKIYHDEGWTGRDAEVPIDSEAPVYSSEAAARERIR